MYLLTLKDKKENGAFSLPNNYGEKVLFLFENKDDAIRYAFMLECEPDYETAMDVVEVDDELAIKTCNLYNYKYTIITSNDIVIPPRS